MKDYEKIGLPHAVYRLYDKTDRLLYVGCSMEPIMRLSRHASLNSHPWVHDIATARIEWHADWFDGRRAEAIAIHAETPLYNRMIIEPDNAGMHTKALTAARRKPRGDGITCPRYKGNPSCNGKKESRKAAYCKSCLRVYSAQWRANRAASIAARLTSRPN